MPADFSPTFIVIALVIAAFIIVLLVRNNIAKVRSRPKVSKERRAKETGNPIPNAHPSEGAVNKTQEVLRFESVQVRRPTMLALTTVRENSAAPEVFIQRAFKIDRDYWVEIDSDEKTRRSLDALFAQTVQLAWVPGSAFERHFYSVSFSPALEAALKSGSLENQAHAVTHVSAIDETGAQMGEVMDFEASGEDEGLVALLWAALNPAGIPHELRGELEDELKEIEKRLTELPEHVAPQTVEAWDVRREKLFELVTDVKSGVAAKTAETYAARIDAVSADMHEQAAKIDKAIDEKSKDLKDLADADDALVHAIAFMYVRDLTVRFMRVCALLRVSLGGAYEDEVRCTNAVSGDVAEFTDVRELIRAADAVAHGNLNFAAVRAANEIELSRSAAISRHAEELTRIHDTFLADLRKEARRVQEDIDRALMRQAKSHRFAVRVSDDAHVEKFFILNA